MQDTQEVWKPIPNYEGLYEVSNFSRIVCCGSEKQKLATFSKNGDYFLKPQTGSLGYKRVLLTKGAIRKTFSIHRLSAMAFIPNPENKPQVNHIDGNKSNNHIGNLEWATSSENIQHCFKTLGKVSCWKGRVGGLHHMSKKVTCIDTGIVYNSIAEASKYYNTNPANIVHALKNNWKCCGVRWEYASTKKE